MSADRVADFQHHGDDGLMGLQTRNFSGWNLRVRLPLIFEHSQHRRQRSRKFQRMELAREGQAGAG
jgi:hypothetical protein